jgi:hypothetical protein
MASINSTRRSWPYDAMCSAIAECYRIDKVKDIHDKALALELYARQAKNTDAERKVADIRLRAERRAGEILTNLAREQGKRNDVTLCKVRRSYISHRMRSPFKKAASVVGQLAVKPASRG